MAPAKQLNLSVPWHQRQVPLPLVVGLVALLLGVAYLVVPSDTFRVQKRVMADFESPGTIGANNLFKEIGLECGTDKVQPRKGLYNHTYHLAYEKYLRHRRQEPLKILEIGLGCDMHGNYTPGRSLCVWQKYAPSAAIHILEYDAKCAESLANKVTRMYSGDQADRELLKRIVEESGPFDVVVDDGGHSWNQQRTSFEVLFPAVVPGGVYILEDLLTSYWGAKNIADAPANTVEMLKDVLEVLMDSEKKKPHNNQPAAANVPLMESMDCFREICVFVRASQV